MKRSVFDRKNFPLLLVALVAAGGAYLLKNEIDRNEALLRVCIDLHNPGFKVAPLTTQQAKRLDHGE